MSESQGNGLCVLLLASLERSHNNMHVTEIRLCAYSLYIVCAGAEGTPLAEFGVKVYKGHYHYKYVYDLQGEM